MDINTKTCGRCGGTGKHSYNLVDGDKCYGCQGLGYVIVTPKGQKKIKPTATIQTCKVGDIIEVNKVLGTVTSIRWIKVATANDMQYNQVIRYTRLVDGEKRKTWRCVYTRFELDAAPFQESMSGVFEAFEAAGEYKRGMGGSVSYRKDRTKVVCIVLLDTPEELIGQEVE